jgi:hypothetical protein
MHEFAYGGTCVVSHYGPVHNPWNLDVTPGGSSGGSAAAVAARLCAGALGTDTAASIRFPAACCGVVGLKATHGLASIRGIVPLSEMHDHVGPIAHSVEDCALIMDAISGFDPLDPVSIRVERGALAGSTRDSVAKLKIGVPRAVLPELDPEIATAVDQALEQLKAHDGLAATSRCRTSATRTPCSAPRRTSITRRCSPIRAKRALYSPITLMRIEAARAPRQTTASPRAANGDRAHTMAIFPDRSCRPGQAAARSPAGLTPLQLRRADGVRRCVQCRRILVF